MNRRKFISNSTALCGASALAGCGGKNKQSQKPFRMQAAWVNDAEFMGYYIAIDAGYYGSSGVDLTKDGYFSGGPEIIPEGKLLAGDVDLALTTPDTTVNLITKEKVKMKIIATQYQKSPLGVVSLVENGITEPEHLVGKTLAVPSVNELSVKAMLRLNDIPVDDVTLVSYQYDPTPLINGQVDATIDFVTNVPYTIKLKGKEATSFLLYDKGFTIYNDTVVVTEQTLIEREAELVAWLRASRKGWEENYIDHTVFPPKYRETWFKDNGRTIENEIFFNKEQKDLMYHKNGYFSMSEDDIDANINALNEAGVKAERSMFVTDLIDQVNASV